MSGYTITFPWLLSILLTGWHEVHLTNPADEWDNMGRQDKEKMINLAKELLIDAKVKQRQIHAVREKHNMRVAYDVGLIIGKIREKYKRMNDIYREAFDRKTNRTLMIPPGVKDFKLLHWIISMELVHAMEVDIDKLVHALEIIPEKTLKDAFRSMDAAKMGTPVTATMPPDANLTSTVTTPKLRAGEDTESSTPRFKSEDELKRFYREQYNARSGRDNNWTLDEYYGVI